MAQCLMLNGNANDVEQEEPIGFFKAWANLCDGGVVNYELLLMIRNVSGLSLIVSELPSTDSCPIDRVMSCRRLIVF